MRHNNSAIIDEKQSYATKQFRMPLRIILCW